MAEFEAVLFKKMYEDSLLAVSLLPRPNREHELRYFRVQVDKAISMEGLRAETVGLGSRQQEGRDRAGRVALQRMNGFRSLTSRPARHCRDGDNRCLNYTPQEHSS